MIWFWGGGGGRGKPETNRLGLCCICSGDLACVVLNFTGWLLRWQLSRAAWQSCFLSAEQFKNLWSLSCLELGNGGHGTLGYAEGGAGYGRWQGTRELDGQGRVGLRSCPS